MIIANPIYDVVFKRLMENERVAKFFIGTLLNEEVVSVNLRPREFTYEKEKGIPVAIFRLDFIAVIKTKEGTHKKVLIEIQKAKNEMDLMRFRNYVAEQYKKKDEIDNEQVVLPITTIYILGFKLPKVETACVKIRRQYHDLINGTILHVTNDFIEKLTHDSFVVQVQRITERYQSRLDKLLSVFEQKNFTDDTEVIKDYAYQADVEEVQLMTNILHKVGTSPKERKEIENEQEAYRTYLEMFEKQNKEHKAEIAERDKKIKENEKEIKEKDKEINEKDTVIKEIKKELKDKDEQLDELKNQMDEMRKMIENIKNNKT